MRTIAGEKPGTEVTYVPKAFDNRDDSDPVRVTYTVPSERERRKMVSAGDSIEVKEDPDNPDGAPIILTRSDAHVDRQAYAIKVANVRVENYAGRAGPIVTAEDLAEHGETEIVTEIYDEIMGNHNLTGDEEKKSEGSRSSSALAIHHLPETAPTAASASSR